MLTIAKTFDFSASHRLFRPDWDDAKNQSVYGKCSNPNGHGHNYRLEVLISGKIDPENGMVFDASRLSAIVEEEILQHVDHKDLNTDVSWLKGQIPTAEVIIEAIWKRLDLAMQQQSGSALLERLVLHETARIYAVKTRER